MMYDKSPVPEHGTPVELMFLLIRSMKFNADIEKTRALMTAAINPEKAQDAFKEYRIAVLPYLVKQEEKEKAELAKVMDRMVAQGPLQITPMVDLGDQLRKMKKDARSAKKTAN